MAAALVIGRIQQNAFGLPAVATTTLVEGGWRDGASLPSLPPPEAWSNEPASPLADLEGHLSATA